MSQPKRDGVLLKARAGARGRGVGAGGGQRRKRRRATSRVPARKSIGHPAGTCSCLPVTLAPMRLFLLAVLALSLWGQKKADVDFLEVKAHRIEEGRITVDGRIRVTGEKPVRGLTVVFDFLSPDNAPLTSLKTQVDDDVVGPGEESSFHAVTMNPPGAVKYKLRVFNSNQRQLRAANIGPYVIE